MPFKSKAQARLMYAASQGKIDKVSSEVANKFIKDSKKVRFSKLKEKLKKKDK